MKGCNCTSLVFLSHCLLPRVVDLWILRVAFTNKKKVLNKMQSNCCLNNIHDDISYSFFPIIRYYEISPRSSVFQIFYLYSLLWTRNRLSSYVGFNPFFSSKVSFLTLEVYVLMIVTHISLGSFRFIAHF